MSQTALMVAVKNHRTEIVKLLCKQKQLLVNHSNKFGGTALILAANTGNLQIFVFVCYSHNYVWGEGRERTLK